MTETNSEAALNAIRDRIKAGIERIKLDRLKIGRDLIEAKSILKHGEFGPWLKENFNWSETSAQSFMNLARLAEKNPEIGDLKPPVAMALAASGASDSVVKEVIAEHKAGKEPIVKEVKAKVAAAKKPKRPKVIDRHGYTDLTPPAPATEAKASTASSVQAEEPVNLALVKLLKQHSLENARRAFEAAFPGFMVLAAGEVEAAILDEIAKEREAHLKAA